MMMDYRVQNIETEYNKSHDFQFSKYTSVRLNIIL